MMIDGYMQFAKTGENVIVKKSQEFHQAFEIQQKYDMWKNEPAFVQGNIDQIAKFLDEKFST